MNPHRQTLRHAARIVREWRLYYQRSTLQAWRYHAALDSFPPGEPWRLALRKIEKLRILARLRKD